MRYLESNSAMAISKRVLAVLTLVVIGACSYTPIYPTTTVETRDSGPAQSDDGSPEGGYTNNDDSGDNAQNQQSSRVAIATPATIDKDSSYDRRRDERSATDELRAQARSASRNGEFDLAERLLNRALRIAPREPLSYYELAELKLKQQQPGSALQMAKKGLSLQPVGRLAKKLKDAEQRANDSIL